MSILRTYLRRKTLPNQARPIVLLLIVHLALSCAHPQSQSKETSIPNSPAGKQFAEWLGTFNNGNLKLITDAAAFKQKIDIGGYGLYLNCSAALDQSGPTVVFEAGLNQDSDTWLKVQSEVAKFARVCSYDRAGLGTSDAPPTQPRTSRQMINDLHLLMEKSGVSAPYILVGHSFGGVNVRLYASTWPKEVVGMVLVDSVHEEETEKWLAMMPAETRKQLEDAGGRRLLGGEAVDIETSMREMKEARWRTSIPLMVLARGRASFNVEDYPPPLRSLAPKGEELRIEMQKELGTRSPAAKFLFAEKSGHMIHHDEPEVVVNAVRQVLEAIKRN